MELYVLSKQDLSILSVSKLADYQINLDEETNAKSSFTLIKTDGLKKDNYIVLNGLYRQFLFVIEDVQTEKDSNVATITALDISNIFDRKIIEKNTDVMKNSSIEQFIANTISENFVNSDDTALNVGYIDIYWHTNTKASVSTNAENGLYNFHTFLINCRQYKKIYTDFKFENGRLRIDISCKEEIEELIDTTLPEVTDYNKIYEEDVTAKVQVYIRENGSEYNLYLKTDRTTTTNKDDPDRANGKIEVISVDTADRAEEEALNVMKGNNYKHLVEFKIAKTSKLMDITKLHIGRPIRIKTDDDIYDSYISAITLSDENFVYFKSGSLRITLLDKLKKNQEKAGNKLDVSGGKITGNLEVGGSLQVNGVNISQEIVTGEEIATNEWIDGKRVFRKRIDCGFLKDNSIKNIPIDLDLSLIFVERLEGVGYRLTDFCTFSLPFASQVPENSITLNTMTTAEGYCIQIVTGVNRTNVKAYVNIYYTKNDKRVIRFTVDNTSYIAEEGMTWREFVDSKYNTLPFVFKDIGWGYLVATNNGNDMYKVVYASNQYNYVRETTVIQNGDTYVYNIEPT